MTEKHAEIDEAVPFALNVQQVHRDNFQSGAVWHGTLEKIASGKFRWPRTALQKFRFYFFFG
ncbi:MAG TPA: hypothetical protein VNE63_15785 [Candidatus Acidoferrales bacterium]|nr:hypothetical protein [Candidatus Acidoferrales bacterium]